MGWVDENLVIHAFYWGVARKHARSMRAAAAAAVQVVQLQQVLPRCSRRAAPLENLGPITVASQPRSALFARWGGAAGLPQVGNPLLLLLLRCCCCAAAAAVLQCCSCSAAAAVLQLQCCSCSAAAALLQLQQQPRAR